MISALLLLITFCLCGNSSDGGFTRYTDSSPASSAQNAQTTEKNDAEVPSSGFPAAPSKILVGCGGETSEYTPDDAEYGMIIEGIKARFEKSGSMGYLRSIATFYDEENGTEKHITEILRRSVVFVEYIYDDPAEQGIVFGKGTRAETVKKTKIARIFFPLTERHHSAFFISEENGEYIQPGISNIADNTELIKNVRSLFESDGTAE